VGWRGTIAVACVLGLAACGRGPAVAPSGSGAPRASGPPPPLGFSVEGRAILCSAYGHGPATALVVGGIHGNEPAGATLPKELCAYLEQHPAALAGRRVVVAAAVNPDGLARNRRANARGVDLNRNFATRNWRRLRSSGAEPMSEPETRFIAGLIRRYEPSVIVQVHQPLTCVDWDGPARELAQAMAGACGLPAKKLGARPGSLGSYAGVERQIPTITLELPPSATGLSPQTLWERYGEALLVAVRAATPPHNDTAFPKVHVGGELRLRWEHFD